TVARRADPLGHLRARGRPPPVAGLARRAGRGVPGRDRAPRRCAVGGAAVARRRAGGDGSPAGHRPDRHVTSWCPSAPDACEWRRGWMGTDEMVFVLVVGSRLLVPLLVFRFPLPAVLAALVIDAADQTIFERFTDFSLVNYQSYDKALDIYYLSLAYLSTLRNWAHPFH